MSELEVLGPLEADLLLESKALERDPQRPRRDSRIGPSLFHACLFYPVFVLIGLQNSLWAAGSGWYRVTFAASSLLLLLYFSRVIRVSNPRQRMIFLVGMLVCAFGENFCVHTLDLYHFAGTLSPPYSIPPYVVLGHGYAIWTALILSEELGARFGARKSLTAFWIAIVTVTAARVVLNNDYPGSVWLLLFLVPYLLSPRDEDRLLLAATYLLATGLESLGVRVKAWDWHASTYYYHSLRFPLHSPPAAVGGFYAMADWITLQILRRFGLEESRPANEADATRKA